MARASLGHGIGLRHQHYRELLERAELGPAPGLEWLEAISENFFEPGGNPRRVLRRMREYFPIALHGVSLALGSVDPLDPGYLTTLDALARELEPALISDHLCWGRIHGFYAHDLLPLPYTEEALRHVSERVLAVQERLGRPIAIENVSSYLQFAHAAMPEWEFLRALVERTGCKLLLDVNNVFVSAHNHGFDARTFLAALPSASIAQIHLAGHSVQGALYLDTHDAPIRPEVWDLYRHALELHGPVATCVEWDDRLPPLARVVAESASAAEIASALVAMSDQASAARARTDPVRWLDAEGSTCAPSLRSVEESFWARIQTASPGAHPPSLSLDALVVSDGRASAAERLELYAQMYSRRLYDSLAQDFPKLAALLGQSCFRELARAYVDACPSHQPSLRHLGGELPAFLRGHALARARPWLAELAALEWARNDLFDRADESTLSLDELRERARHGFQGLYIRLIEAHALIAVEHAIDVTWREPELHAPARSPRTLLVWRQPDLDVYHRALDPDEAELGRELAAGVAFELICERLCARHAPAAAAARAAELLASWASGGLLRPQPTQIGRAQR